MKILLLGCNGQVGWALQRSLAPLGELIALNRQQADFEYPEQLCQMVQQIQPTVIVNAAAYTAVDQAESEPSRAYRVNAQAVEQLATAAQRINAWLVSYSTDYVFDGTQQRAYVEHDLPCPVNVYGHSKWQGEQAIRLSRCQHLIFRTSWVYALHGHNFASTIVRLAKERDQLQVVNDQRGTPTSAELIADITALALYRIGSDRSFAERVSGTYHLTAEGETTWYHYAQFVVQQILKSSQALKVTADRLQPISTVAYPLPAQRPANGCLNSDKLKEIFGITLPAWQYHLHQFLTLLARCHH